MESEYWVVFGVSDLSDKILSIASSSACREAYTDASIDPFQKVIIIHLYITRFICSVSCFCYQFSVSYEDTADWNFAGS